MGRDFGDTVTLKYKQLIKISALQRKRETSDTDGESSLPNTPSVEDSKKEKKKKKKAKHQEAESEGLGQEAEAEVRNSPQTPFVNTQVEV